MSALNFAEEEELNEFLSDFECDMHILSECETNFINDMMNRFFYSDEHITSDQYDRIKQIHSKHF